MGSLAALAALWAMAGTAGPAGAADGFDRLVGRWSCDGYFVKSGAKIASSLDVTRDPATGALIVRRDDSAPNVYHALEVWTSTRGAAPFRAAIANNGGMRWYVSDGWVDGSIVWSRSGQGEPEERFAYAIGAQGDLQVDWLIARPGEALALGDRLACRKA
ncbi:MAG: hypothetical protein WC729_05425 [Sphingomonas sp.]|jgi:hypothetical protein|uniref:hypothetical protein n=1 Tax=Sphingomonas sp. TaxID=28214 RepID=UPI0035617236